MNINYHYIPKQGHITERFMINRIIKSIELQNYFCSCIFEYLMSYKNETQLTYGFPTPLLN